MKIIIWMLKTVRNLGLLILVLIMLASLAILFLPKYGIDFRTSCEIGILLAVDVLLGVFLSPLRKKIFLSIPISIKYRR